MDNTLLMNIKLKYFHFAYTPKKGDRLSTCGTWQQQLPCLGLGLGLGLDIGLGLGLWG